MQPASIFSDWLAQLGVRHTRAYSDRQFSSMPFRTLFGLSKLMQSYGVATRGIRLGDAHELLKLPVPYVAQTTGGEMVIVNAVYPDSVSYLSQGRLQRAATDDFCSAATGVALLAAPQAGATEPDYVKHRFAEIMLRLRDFALWTCVGALLVYIVVAHGLEGHWYTAVIALLDIGGLALSFMLVQKTVGVHTRIASRVCGVLQKGGCDDILAGSAATFLGIFHWSEVGLGYFSVSLAVLLLFPSIYRISPSSTPVACHIHCGASAISASWPTAGALCVGVQATLWLLFFCYLGGGCFRGAWPPHLSLPAIAAAYVAAVCALNKYSPLLRHLYHADNNTSSES